METDFAVLVIGAGGAGLAGAVAAAEAGARVLVVEAAAQAGGATALSGGNILAAGSRAQAAAGVKDDAEALYRDLCAINLHRPRAGVVRAYAQAAPATLDWLGGHGVHFDPHALGRTGGASVPRAHRAAGLGAGLTASLELAARKLGVEFAFNTRVTEVLRDADGAVQGLRHEGEVVTAGAVLLATGGFGAEPELRRRHLPLCGAEGQDWYIGPDTNRGDGLRLAQGLGADLWGEGEGLVMLGAGLSRDLEVYLPPWLLWLNGQGRRFVDEAGDYVILAQAVQEQPDGCAWALFDAAARAGAGRGATDPRTAFAAPNWTAEALAGHAAAGRLVTAASLAELAARLGLAAAVLEGEVDRYNRHCSAGLDPDHEKPAVALKALRRPPFHAVRLLPSVVALTGMGPRIDAQGHVLRHGAPIPGLYAAGEVTGGLGGRLYAGNGASVGNAVVFGRLAGQAAARHALGLPSVP